MISIKDWLHVVSYMHNSSICFMIIISELLSVTETIIYPLTSTVGWLNFEVSG